jgi:Tfp pilus assembly protein PilV
MKKNSKVILGAVGVIVSVAVVGALALTSASAVSAQEAESENSTPLIIQNLVKKFGLEEDEVEEVFEQTREERGQERLKNLGVPEDKIEAVKLKQEEMREKVEAVRNAELSLEDRHEAMQSIREEAESWAEQNDIDPRALRGGGVMGRGRMGGVGTEGKSRRGNGECISQ